MQLHGRILASVGCGGRWRVTLIRAGTSRRGWPTYPASMLRASLPLFEGRPALLYPKHDADGNVIGEDHQARGALVGRGVANMVGHYEGVRWVESDEAVEATLVLALDLPEARQLDDRLRALESSGGLQALGLSIDGDGDIGADGAVHSLHAISSIDIVTHPAMGGAFRHRIAASTTGVGSMNLLQRLRARFPRLLEGYSGPAQDWNLARWMQARLRESEEARAELLAGLPESMRESAQTELGRITESVDALALLDECQMLISIVRESLQQAAGSAIAAGAAELPASAPAPAAPPAAPAPVQESATAELERRLQEMRIRESARDLREAARAANLPVASLNRLAEAHAGRELLPEQIAAIVARETQTVDAILRESRGTRARVIEADTSQAAEVLAHLFNPGRCPLPQGYDLRGRHGYSLHRFCESFWGIDLRRGTNMAGRSRLREAVDATNFDQVFADALNRSVVAAYRGDASLSSQAWRQIAKVTSVSDFRAYRRIKMGYYGTLPAVAEGGSYDPLTTPTDSQETVQLAKVGGTEQITWEKMLNDDLGIWQELVRRMGLSAAEGLNDAVFSLLRIATMPTMADTYKLMSATRTPANLGTLPLTGDATGFANLMTTVGLMLANPGGGGKAKGVKPTTLVVPLAKAAAAGTLMSDFGANTSAADFPSRQGLQVLGVSLRNVVVDLYATNQTDWMLLADPNDAPVIEVAFLDGQEDPEVFFDNNQNVSGMFTNDLVKAKIRHVYDAAAIDHVGIQGNDAAS